MNTVLESVKGRAAKVVDVLFEALSHRPRDTPTPLDMGSLCSRSMPSNQISSNQKPRLKGVTKKPLRRSQAGASPLLDVCLQQLALQASTLTSEQVNRLSDDLAQLLFDHIVSTGKLNGDVLDAFRGVALWKLELHACPGVYSGWVAKLAGTHLITVDLSYTLVDDTVMPLLACHRNIKSLNLSGTTVTTEGLALLSRFRRLSQLHLDDCHAIYGDINNLSTLPCLRRLSLRNSQHVAPNMVLLALENVPSLQHLDVSWCKSGTRSPRTLDMMTPKPLYSGLRTVSFANSGLSHRSLQCLRFMTALEELNLSGYALDDEASGVSSLNACDAPMLPEGPLAVVGQLNTVKKLHLRWCQVPKQAWPHLAKLTELTHLDLSYTDASDASLRSLSALTHLAYLDLDSTDVTNVGIAALEPLQCLTFLNLADTKMDNFGLPPITALRSLSSLNLSYTNITDTGVAMLTALLGLTYLSIDSRLISDAGIKHLEALQRLVALDLFGCKLTYIGCVSVAKLTSLKWLEVAGGVLCDMGVASLCRMTQLTYLSLAQNASITNSSYPFLAKFSHLRNLNVSGTGMSAPPGTVLKDLPDLRSLSVYGLKCPRGYTEKMAAAFPELKVVG